MGLGLRPDHVRRYAEVVRVPVRHGRRDLVLDG